MLGHVVERQQFLLNMVTQMEAMAERAPLVELVEVPAVESNSAIFQRATTAATSLDNVLAELRRQVF